MCCFPVYKFFYCLFYFKLLYTQSKRPEAGLIHKREMLLKQVCCYSIFIGMLYISPLSNKFLLWN